MTHRALKREARQRFSKHPRPYLVIGTTLLALLTVIYLLQSYGGSFFVPLLLPLDTFPMELGLWPASASVVSGLFSLSDLSGLPETSGYLFSLPMDVAGFAMVVVLPWGLLIAFLVTQGAILLLLSPFRQGTLEQCHRITTEQAVTASSPFLWYTKPGLVLRALAVQGGLAILRFAILAPLSAIGLLLSYFGMTRPLLAVLGLVVSVIAPLIAYAIYCIFLPAQYMLAQQPTLSPIAAFRQGLALTRGRRKAFFKLRMSFLPWDLFATAFSNLPASYVYPYKEMTTTLFLMKREE